MWSGFRPKQFSTLYIPRFSVRSSLLIAHTLKFCSDKKKASHIFQTASDNSFAMKVPKQVGNEISIIRLMILWQPSY